MSRGMCTTLVTAQSIIAAAKLREVECMEYRLARAETISDSYIITLVLLFKLDIMSAGLQRDNMEYSLARVVTGCGSKLAVLALSAQLSTAAAGLRDLLIVNYGHARAGVGSNSKHITLVLMVKLYIPAAELQKNKTMRYSLAWARTVCSSEFVLVLLTQPGIAAARLAELGVLNFRLVREVMWSNRKISD